MKNHTDKTRKNRNQSVARNLSQGQNRGESAFQFVDNRPEAAVQRKIQEMANNSSQVKQTDRFRSRTTQDVMQLVEAGAQPIRVNEGDKDNKLSISGLINCVGVVIMIYGENDKQFDHVAVVGGHFVTPNMYRFNGEQGFTDAGQTFIDDIRALIVGIDDERLEATYYVKRPVIEGANPESLVQATVAAKAIRSILGLNGEIVQMADNILVSV